jgi:hypothetical protein
MNIKSLLLGSAAALVAVSGARAADAVVIAEPEPMEYVRVCDTYGVGFYYIPGTETCLRIGGLLRYDIDYNDAPDDVIEIDPIFEPVYTQDDADAIAGGADPDDFTPIGQTLVTEGAILEIDNGLDDGWAKTAYARLNIDARSETEFGTFRRFIRLAGSVRSGEDESELEVLFAYIELGGLLVGLYDTLYDGDISPEFDSGGGSSAHQIRYTFHGANGLMFQASVEEQDYDVDYTPNVVGRIGFAQGWGGVALFGAYDATTEEFGAKFIGSFEATDAFLLEMLATYESGEGDFSVNTQDGTYGYEFSLAGAVSFKASDKFTLRGGGQYFWNAHDGGYDNYRVGGQVDYNVVENLLFRVQVHYNGGDTQDFVDAKGRLESSF